MSTGSAQSGVPWPFGTMRKPSAEKSHHGYEKLPKARRLSKNPEVPMVSDTPLDPPPAAQPGKKKYMPIKLPEELDPITHLTKKPSSIFRRMIPELSISKDQEKDEKPPRLPEVY